MSFVWAATLRSITSRPWATRCSSNGSLRRRCVQPRMAPRGLRSSWESVARNSSFMRFASRASA